MIKITRSLIVAFTVPRGLNALELVTFCAFPMKVLTQDDFEGLWFTTGFGLEGLMLMLRG